MQKRNLWKECIRAHQKGDIVDAKQKYTNYINKFPLDSSAKYNLGLIFISENDFSSAVSLFRKVLELDPSNDKCVITLALAFANLKLLEELISLHAEYPNVFEKSEELKRATKAIDHRDPANEHLVKIELDLRYKNYDKVLDEANTLLHRYPFSAKVIEILSKTYFAMGEWDNALVCETNLINLERSNPKPHYNLGIIYWNKDKLEHAINAFNAARNLDPNFYHAHLNAGFVLALQSRFEDAVFAFEEAKNIADDDPQLFFGIGRAYFELSRYLDAKEYLKNAVELNPLESTYFDALGSACLMLGDVSEAFLNYEKAYEIDPENATTCMNILELSIQYPLKNDPNIVEKYLIGFEKVEFGDYLPKFHVLCALYFFLAEDFSEAKICLEKYDQEMAARGAHLEVHDNLFCSAFSSFIRTLMPQVTSEAKWKQPVVYHLGESHSLTYNAKEIEIGGSSYKVKPMITFGAKAYHLGSVQKNKYKSLSASNFLALPNRSTVFLSFGEIDCRPNEGIITTKCDADDQLSQVVETTVRLYVEFFEKLNKKKEHTVFLMEVPSPVYQANYGKEINETRLSIIQKFNYFLKIEAIRQGFSVISVQAITSSKNGFSNKRFHVDNYHLGADFVDEIQKQIAVISAN